MIKIITPFLFLSVSLPLFSQKIVTGTVTEKSGFPMPGVSVVIKGTRMGTATDVNGNFQLTIYPDSATLIFEFIGYQRKEYSVTSESTIDVVLKEECIACYFDLDQMQLSLSSGVAHTPWGGKAVMNIPLFIGQRVLKTGYEYQSDLRENYQVNSAIGITHLFHNCYYHLQVNLFYSKIEVENTVPLYRSYVGEVNMDIFRDIFFLK